MPLASPRLGSQSAVMVAPLVLVLWGGLGACGKPATYTRLDRDGGGRDLGTAGTGGAELPGSGGANMGSGGDGAGATGGAGDAGAAGTDTGGASAGSGGAAGGAGGGGGGANAGAGGGAGGIGNGGGAMGGGGPGGAAGMAGAPFSCIAPVTPVNGVVTDFADWNPATQMFGGSGPLAGALFSYAGTGSTATVVVDTGARNLHFTAAVAAANYAGFGLSFDACTSAASYNAVQFSIAGTVGGCALELQAQTYSDKAVDIGGDCVSGCNLPVKKNLPTTTVAATVTVPFADLTTGAPRPFNAAEIVGLQWQITVPLPPDGGAQRPCAVDLRLDDIKYLVQ